MSIYVIAAVNKNDNEADLQTYERYVIGAGPSLSKYAVEVLAADEQPKVVEGMLPGRKIVLLRFRDQQHLDDWYTSEEYQEVVPLRWGAAHTAFLISFQGLD